LESLDQSNSITHTVSPGEEKLVVYQATGSKASINYKISTVFKKTRGELIKLALSNGKREHKYYNHLTPRKYRGNIVGISCYMLKFKGGILFLYENNSSQFVLREYLQFKLQNMKMEQEPEGNNSKRIELFPGEREVLELSVVNTTLASTMEFRSSLCEVSPL